MDKNKEITAIGFDFGMKYIGIAVGQTITRTAQALTTLSAIHGIPNWDEIAKIIAVWQPNVLIVGLPLNMDGTAQRITENARQFGQMLKERFELPVYFEDERLSTIEAREKLFSQGGYRALTKKAVDSLSAKIILESWFHH